jgi:hypothetical protein
VEKTLGLLLMIGLGVLLQRKIGAAEQLKGLKVIILSLALPATIFAALLNVELNASLWILPVFALGVNAVMLLVTRFAGKLYPELSSSHHHTLMMLIPSLAPGLSCFPFVMEYLGSDMMALAAVADVGNKVFVLVLLYLLAMHWHHQSHAPKVGEGRLKQLLVAMFGEPINLVIIAAVIMLGFGWNLQSLPSVVGDVILRISGIMAPLILLFIGLAVKTSRKEAGLIVQFLTWRAGLMLMLSGVVILLVPDISNEMILLLIVFPQSAVSFWPYAHMSVINGLESNDKKTFDVNFALSILAVSLPFSTLIILGVFSFQFLFSDPAGSFSIGVGLIALGLAPQLVRRARKRGLVKSMIPNEVVNEDSRNEHYVKLG